MVLDFRLFGILFAFFFCLNIAFFYDNNNSNLYPVPERLVSIREWLQSTRWFSIHLPVPVLFILEVIVTRKLIRDNKIFGFCIAIGALLSSLIAILWTLDPMNSADEPIRHFLARIVLVGSVFMIMVEVYLGKKYDFSGSQLSTRICFSLIKPMIMLNGHTF